MNFLEKILSESYSNLEEAGLIINKKDGAYPKSDQILIMAGGAGSGKSFIREKLLLFDGKVFNPDDTLELLLKYGRKYPNSNLAKKFLKEKGKELKNIDLKNSSDVNLVYEFIATYHLHLDKEAMFFKAMSKSSIKPNVIFDIQMKDLINVEYIYQYAILGGYKPENIHIVWVLNDVNISLNQNSNRERVVDTNFLKNCHIAVAKTFSDLIKDTEKWQKIVNGDIWIVFNKKGIDIKTVTTVSKKVNDKGETSYSVNTNIDDSTKHPYFAVHVKEQGKPAKQWNEISKAIINKIKTYVPEEVRDLF